MKPFIPITAVLLGLAFLMAFLRFGSDQDFSVAIDIPCAAGEDTCFVTTCDEVYEQLLGCTAGEEISIQTITTSAPHFLSCLANGSCQL